MCHCIYGGFKTQQQIICHFFHWEVESIERWKSMFFPLNWNILFLLRPKEYSKSDNLWPPSLSHKWSNRVLFLGTLSHYIIILKTLRPLWSHVGLWLRFSWAILPLCNLYVSAEAILDMEPPVIPALSFWVTPSPESHLGQGPKQEEQRRTVSTVPFPNLWYSSIMKWLLF